MALEAHLNKLKIKHKEMESKITKESGFPAIDQFKINGLKREKMKLKEEISNIESQIAS